MGKVTKKQSKSDLRLFGAILPVRVEIPTELADQLQKSGQTIPSPILGVALVDTGASRTCVDETVIQQLGIKSAGRGDVGSADGISQRELYPARLVFPNTNLSKIECSHLAGLNLGWTVALDSKKKVIALIGRDILGDCLFVYDGPRGTFTLTEQTGKT
jgi:hypothetical protein